MISRANRGRALERLIEVSNAAYRRQGRAVVHKIPTAWLPLRDGRGRIVSAKVEQKAVVDFLGVLAGGRAVAFDAKQNREATRFPLDGRWGHEVEFIRDVMAAGGIGFLIVEQVARDRIYLVPGALLVQLWDEAQRGGRRSIPLSVLETCPVVPRAPGIPVDWLAALEQIGA